MMLLKFAVCLILIITTTNADLTIGTDFILAFPCSTRHYISSLIVVNSNSNQANLIIESSVSNFTTMQRTVAGNSGLQINFTDGLAINGTEVCDLDVVSKQGFRVQSSVGVALYAFEVQKGGENAGQYLVLPTNMLSSQYVGGNGEYNGIIVAKQNGTIVTIGSSPSKQVTLNLLDVYYAKAASPISANYPFALIYTYSKFPGIYPYSSVMALPNTYASTGSTIAPEIWNIYVDAQIWALENNTQVTINAGPSVSVPIGQPYELQIPGGGGEIISTKPVHVVSYNHLLGYAYYPSSLLSSNVQFYTLSGTSPTLMIIAPISSTGNIRLDGQAIPILQYNRIPYSHVYYYTQEITGPNMLHTISTTTQNDRYMAYIYYAGSFSGSTGTKYPIVMNVTSTS